VQDEAVEITTSNGAVSGITTAMGVRYRARAVILATGVYLKSKIIIGEFQKESGPAGLFPANSLSGSLTRLGFALRRFKTGTPARVDERSIDYSKTVPQYGDRDAIPFSFMTDRVDSPDIPCYLTYTNERTKEIIQENIHRSPLYSGVIEGIGARYCPSIEDKMVKFPDKERHQLFLEPEGRNTREIYVQGMSSSLPPDVQVALYRTVPGLEQVRFVRPAYAIEYDCIDPTRLGRDLCAKDIPGLYMAGQINGTSGYEEAAAQGIVAGINASLWLDEEPPVILGRDHAYAGVLINDLVTKGTNEPYRMMTARAEYRLLLRQDNADARLTQIGRDVGLVGDARYDKFMRKMEMVEKETARLRERTVPMADADTLLVSRGMNAQGRGAKMAELLKRGFEYRELPEADLSLPKDAVMQVENNIKYEGYIAKQRAQVQAARAMEDKKIPGWVDYEEIKGLRLEARAKLNDIRPDSVGQASRVPGVSPADISVLLVYLAANDA
jgi:tRNA uridine 5-carboxymethylaminomethyl modification enzyme